MRHKRLIIITLDSKILYIMAILFCLGLGFWVFRQPSVWTSLPLSTVISGKKIVVDAGHGGRDPGTRSADGLVEKELNLDIALQLKKKLSRVGVYCVMTREEDRDFFDSQHPSRLKKRRDLLERARIANESKADLFLSIHANSFPESIYYGAQTFFDPRDPESKKLAQAVQYSLVKRLGPNKRTPKPGEFRVLSETQMTAVMVEVGFLSNPREAGLLKQPEYREKVAEAIFEGLVTYYSRAPVPEMEVGGILRRE